jgi:uncharacterized protein YegL
MDNIQRLPIYILADRSGSMTGAPITAVNQGIQTLLSDLMGDGKANEVAFLSVLSFADDCRQDLPLTEVQAITPPDLKAGGRTAFGAALRKAAECIRDEVRLNDRQREVLGDWAPLLFILTDGEPTDDWRSGWMELRSLGRRYPYIVAVACGPDAKPDLLRQLIIDVERNGQREPFGQVIMMNNMSADSFRRCFQLLSQKSVKFGENPMGMITPVVDPAPANPVSMDSLPPLPSPDPQPMDPLGGPIADLVATPQPVAAADAGSFVVNI